MKSQEIYARLQESADDNKKLWALSQEFEALYRKLAKAEKKAGEIGKIDFDDTESMRQAVFEHLFAESKKGNAQASHRLGEYLRLADKDRDITIEVINYNDIKKESTPPKKKRRKTKSTTTK